MDLSLHLGNCLDLLPALPDGSIDLILCDLPYGQTTCAWDSVIPMGPLWAQYRRLITERGAIVLTAAQPFTSVLIASAPDLFKYCWVWEKTKPQNFMNAKNAPMRVTEDVVVFAKGTTANKSPRRMTYNPQGLVPFNKRVKNQAYDKDDSTVGLRPSRLANSEYVREFTNYPRNILKFPSEHAKLHPTQKPVALMEYLIATYTAPGDTVLDNAMGSGTTGAACIATGRKFIGMEQDAAHFATAQNRLGNLLHGRK